MATRRRNMATATWQHGSLSLHFAMLVENADKLPRRPRSGVCTFQRDRGPDFGSGSDFGSRAPAVTCRHRCLPFAHCRQPRYEAASGRRQEPGRRVGHGRSRRRRFAVPPNYATSALSSSVAAVDGMFLRRYPALKRKRFRLGAAGLSAKYRNPFPVLTFTGFWLIKVVCIM